MRVSNTHGPMSRDPGRCAVASLIPSWSHRRVTLPTQAAHRVSFLLKFTRLVGTRTMWCMIPSVRNVLNRQLQGDRTWTHDCQELGARGGEQCLTGPEFLSGVTECSAISGDGMRNH